MVFLPLLLFCFVALTSCDKSLDKVYSVPSSSPVSIGEQTLPTANGELTPPDQLFTKEVDIHAVVEKYFMGQNQYGNIYGTNRLEELAEDIGMECVRDTDAGTLYSVHKVKQGGRLYLIYDTSIYSRVIRWFYVQKKLSYNDFSAIKEGSSLDAVKRIDPATQIFENLYNSEKDFWKEAGGMVSWHYLTDGILEIGYDISGSTPKVMIMKYAEDYQIEEIADRSRYYNCEILPADRIE